MAISPRILAWRIPRTEEPGGLQSMGLQESETTSRLNHQSCVTSSSLLVCLRWRSVGPGWRSGRIKSVLNAEPGAPTQTPEDPRYFFFLWLCPPACGVLVPWPGIKSMRPALEAQSVNRLSPLIASQFREWTQRARWLITITQQVSQWF